MMKRMLVFVAFAVSAFASAQGFGQPVNLAFRVGFAYPVDEVIHDSASNLVGVGVDFFLQRPFLSGGDESWLSADWIGRGANGDKPNIYPIMLNQRWYTGGDYESGNRSYYFFGLGIAIVDVVSAKTVPAVKVGLGRELGAHMFGEMTLIHSDSANGARATSVGAYLGYRF